MKKGIKVLAVGSMIVSANLVPVPITHSSAEEISVQENSTSLSVLEIAEFELNQTFSSEVTNYTASVSNEIKSMSLLMEAAEEGTAISVNGKSVTSGEAEILPIETGENIFMITVSNGTDMTTYTLTVVRAKSNNNQLANLALSNGQINFNKEVTNYDIQLDSEISNLTVKPESAAETSTVKVNNLPAGTDGVDVVVPVGKSTITIDVIAEDGSQNTYTINVVRENSSDTKQDNQTPSSPTITTDKETPTVSNNSKPTGITSSASSSKEEIGSSADTSSTAATVAGGSKSGGSQAGSESSSSQAATTANLSSLIVSNGTWNKSFDSNVYTYHVAVGNDVTSVTINVSPEESGAEVKIEDGDSTTLTLENKPKTTVSVVVTNGNDQKTYVLIFDKEIEEAVTAATTTEVAEASTKTTASSDQTEARKSTRSEASQTTVDSNNTTTESSSFWSWIKSLFGF